MKCWRVWRSKRLRVSGFAFRVSYLLFLVRVLMNGTVIPMKDGSLCTSSTLQQPTTNQCLERCLVPRHEKTNYQSPTTKAASYLGMKFPIFNSQTQNPKLKTQNPKPNTRNSKHSLLSQHF